MIHLRIDGKEIAVEEGTTVIDAAGKAGITIPSLCNFEGIEPPVSCFVCAVKIEGRNGFVPSCVALAEEGMVVESNSEAVFKSRRQALELLLSHHNGDCEAPCTRICPCSIDIPELVRKIITGDRAGMISLIRAAMPFPAVLGYICSAPCQNGCRRKQVDTAISIRDLHTFAALAAMDSSEDSSPTMLPPTGKKVAIVGAGLAGLTTAYHLSCLGHTCTIIEKNSRPGGPLSYELDEHVLPPKILDYEIDQIRKCGATFLFNKEVTSLQELRGTFDATVIACGSQSTQWIQQQGIRCTERGIEVHKGTFATSIEGVFSIGGAIIPGKSASRTVGQSKIAAQSIHRFLSGINDLKPENSVFDSYMGRLPADDLKRFSDSIPKVNTVLSEKQNIPVTVSENAVRCLQCDCGKKNGCDLRRYAGQYGAIQNRYKLDKPLKSERRTFSGGLVYEPGKCICCGRCVGITTAAKSPLNPPQGDLNNKVQTNHLDLKSPPAGDLGGARFIGGTKLAPGLSFFNRGSDLYVGTPFGEPMDEAMGSCMDKCVDACPTGALWKVK